MSSPPFLTPRRHPAAQAVAALHEELDGLRDLPVWSMSEAETRSTLTAMTQLQAKLDELEARLAGHADELAAGDGVGATSTAAWWATESRLTRAEAHRKVRLARSLATHDLTRAALARGQVVEEQARVVMEAVDQLPADLVDQGLRDQAEAALLEHAAHHDARGLKRLGARVLECLAPDVAEAHEARVLEREERDAAAACRLAMSEDGHGRFHGRFTLPTVVGTMLQRQVEALIRNQDDETRVQPLPSRRGQAFAQWIERYPVDRLPTSGGTAVTVVVTMTLETLLGGLAAAGLDTGARISAGEARRLACDAQIIPAVLGGKSEVLDLGRGRRLHNKAQRIALGLRDGGCSTQGCDRPAAWCEAHHEPPWSEGNGTSVAGGRLLCRRHHRLAHHPGYRTTHLANGAVTFHRRE